MSLKFILDIRERGLIDLLKTDDNSITVEVLDVGDFQIIKDDGTVLLVIERKSIADLAASIKDGRYHEQKQRLKSLCNKIIYLIEGKVVFDDSYNLSIYGNLNNKAIVSSLLNSSLCDNIYIFNTKNLEESGTFIQCLINRYSKNLEKYICETNNTNKEYNATNSTNVKCKKRDNVDSVQCLILQLNSIPGISTNKSRSIINYLQVNNMKELLLKLDDLNNCPGIGKKLTNTINNYLRGSNT